MDKVAYLLRFADIDPNQGGPDRTYTGASLESAWAWDTNFGSFHYGLQLQNSGKSPFSYWQGFVFDSNTGPNACDFAAGSSGNGFEAGDFQRSISYTHAGVVPAIRRLP